MADKSHGGKRNGAGRPKKKGAVLAEADGEMPIDFLMSVVRDTDEKKGVRIDAAKSAMPYLYPRLSSITLDNENEDGFTVKIVERVVVKTPTDTNG